MKSLRPWPRRQLSVQLHVVNVECLGMPNVDILGRGNVKGATRNEGGQLSLGGGGGGVSQLHMSERKSMRA